MQCSFIAVDCWIWWTAAVITNNYCLKTSQFQTACKDDVQWLHHSNKTAKIKKVILLNSTSPQNQCAVK